MKFEIDMEQINSLVNKKLDDAKRISLDIIEKCKFKNITKKTHLIHDIEKAPTSNEVCRIMYFMVLAGEGLSVTGSEWQKKYN